MKRIKPLGITVIILFFLLVLNSCFGINMDIALNQNGSGTLSLEYKISKSLDSLGKLDGNERWNTIPVGKADFERTLSRLPGMKLLSFSSKEDNRDLIINAKMEFSNIQVLLAFLDASGKNSSFRGEPSSGSMGFVLSDGATAMDQGLSKLIEELSRNYSIKISMNFPSEGKLSVLDNSGKILAPIEGSIINAKGKTVSCFFPLYAVLSYPSGLNIEFSW